MALKRKSEMAVAYRELIAAEHELDIAERMHSTDVGRYAARVDEAVARHHRLRATGPRAVGGAAGERRAG